MNGGEGWRGFDWGRFAALINAMLIAGLGVIAGWHWTEMALTPREMVMLGVAIVVAVLGIVQTYLPPLKRRDDWPRGAPRRDGDPPMGEPPPPPPKGDHYAG